MIGGNGATIIDEMHNVIIGFWLVAATRPVVLYLSARKMREAKEEVGRQCDRLVGEGITEFKFDGVLLLEAPAHVWPEIVASGEIFGSGVR
jgi:hypothetical protein